MSMIAARPRILTKDVPWKKSRLIRNARTTETTKRMRKIEYVPIGI